MGLELEQEARHYSWGTQKLYWDPFMTAACNSLKLFQQGNIQMILPCINLNITITSSIRLSSCSSVDSLLPERNLLSINLAKNNIYKQQQPGNSTVFGLQYQHSTVIRFHIFTITLLYDCKKQKIISQKQITSSKCILKTAVWVLKKCHIYFWMKVSNSFWIDTSSLLSDWIWYVYGFARSVLIWYNSPIHLTMVQKNFWTFIGLSS